MKNIKWLVILFFAAFMQPGISLADSLSAFGVAPLFTGITVTPEEPRIFLHYDYMVGSDGYSWAPSEAAVQMVVEAFRRRGIILDIDPVHNAIPEFRTLSLQEVKSPYTMFDPVRCTSSSHVSLTTLMAQYFQSRNPFERYAVFGRYNTCDSDESCAYCAQYLKRDDEVWYNSSGKADQGRGPIGGQGLIVTLGSLRDLGVDINQDPIVTAGTIMHELGHTLGLRHGGDDDIVQKPNYVSVMNYSYQFGIGYVLHNKEITDDTTDPSDFYGIDYSDRVLSALHEGVDSGNNTCVSDNGPGLDERAGLVTGTNQVIVYYTNYGGVSRYALGYGAPIDWDGDGQIEDHAVFADVAGNGHCSELHGFDDWAQVRSNLKDQWQLFHGDE